jgi:hypothetical protein
MIDGDGVLTKAEFLKMLEAYSEELLFGIAEMLGAPGAREARQREQELRATDPTFAVQVAAVRKAREQGAFITEGVDVGYRRGPGLRKLAGPTGDDDDETLGPAQRAIRRKLRRGREP